MNQYTMKNEIVPAYDAALSAGVCPPRSRKILIVEDDAEVLKVISQILSDLGYQSIQCGLAQDAYDGITSRSIEVDLILVDYRLPNMTGLDLIAMLRQENCNIPVVMMTGYAATEERVSAEGMEGFTILKKPIVVDQLAKALVESLSPTT
jgi:DNA-binding NtrC family response regulator